jgi:GNAT superfamily N-acetyltransferase
VRRAEGLDDFLDAAATFLERGEARHVLHWATLDVLRARPELAARRPYLATVVIAGKVAGTVTMLPRNPLAVSPLLPAEALPAVADDLVADGRAEQVTDISSIPELVEPFLHLWRERTGRAGHVHMRMRLYRIDAAPPVPAIPGQFLMAGEDDLDLLLEWSIAFDAEAAPATRPLDVGMLRAGILQRVSGREGLVGLWVDGGAPVAMAAYFAGAPPRPARVAPVYTPPALRRRGYGTAVTAAVTRAAFERGHRSCALFTDLANPTSNSIYAAIGYRPVTDWVHAAISTA